jgi:uncharacterized protein YlzI (FlbEa/FlbD family)
MIKLTGRSGDAVYVNPNAISAIMKDEDSINDDPDGIIYGYEVFITGDPHPILVRETPEEIVRMIDSCNNG